MITPRAAAACDALPTPPCTRSGVRLKTRKRNIVVPHDPQVRGGTWPPFHHSWPALRRPPLLLLLLKLLLLLLLLLPPPRSPLPMR